MKTNWNDGMDYGFSVIKSIMEILGLWPLQNDTIFTMRWFMTFATVFFTLINVLIEPFRSCGVPRDGLENLRMIESSLHASVNIIFPRIYMKRLTVNINSAVDDWTSLALKKESRLIMTAYARIGRLITLSHLIIGWIAFVIWYTSVFLSNREKVAINDTAWTFVFPSTCLYKGISYSTYKILFVIQIIQGSVALMSECVCDSFFFSIIMHLCGQLKLLKIQFLELFNQKRNDEKHKGNILRPLIKRHCHLIVLNKNIEDAFYINMLVRFLIISVVIAASGVEVILSYKNQDYRQMMKMLLSIQFYMIKTLLCTYAGDILQNQSELIIHAIYNSTWYEMSPIIMKDLVFVMMRLKNPLQISAGKFFYLTRRTMTDILKTTLTYISFLQMTMDE